MHTRIIHHVKKHKVRYAVYGCLSLIIMGTLVIISRLDTENAYANANTTTSSINGAYNGIQDNNILK